MSILLSNEILSAVVQELKGATESVQVITAYCKENSIKHLSQFIRDDILEKRLMVRFRLDDIINGSTDFSVLDYCLSHGWDIYIRFDLHAKTYIIDNKRCLVSSANATNSGLRIGGTGNMEVGTLVDIEPCDISKINALFRDAILVTEQVHDVLKKQYSQIRVAQPGKNLPRWDNNITDLFKPHFDTLFSHELPDMNSIEEGKVISFLDCVYDGNISKIKEVFRWSPAYLWLLTVLEENEGCLYFGSLSEKLHNALVTDPKPYRKDVKILLANLLELISDLDMEEVIVDRPNYSQRVRLGRRL